MNTGPWTVGRDVDLDALGFFSGEVERGLAALLHETPEFYAKKAAQAMREAFAQRHGSCPWSTWAIKEALLARMKEAK